MALEALRAIAMVTYYHHASDAATPDREDVRRLALHFKEYTRRPPARVAIGVGGRTFDVDGPRAAHEVLAALVRERIGAIARRLGLEGDTRRPVLVPIPSSEAVAFGGPARWPARTIADTLAAVGLGIAAPLVRFAHAQASTSGGSGQRPEAPERFAALVCDGPPPPPGPLVLVDDMITRGATAAACAARIRDRFGVGANGLFSVACTDHRPVPTALAARECVIYYDRAAADGRWALRCDDG